MTTLQFISATSVELTTGKKLAMQATVTYRTAKMFIGTPSLPREKREGGSGSERRRFWRMLRGRVSKGLNGVGGGRYGGWEVLFWIGWGADVPGD